MTDGRGVSLGANDARSARTVGRGVSLGVSDSAAICAAPRLLLFLEVHDGQQQKEESWITSQQNLHLILLKLEITTL